LSLTVWFDWRLFRRFRLGGCFLHIRSASVQSLIT
jgi:hypothetical protein